MRYAALNHRIPSLAYAFEEKDDYSISKEGLAATGLRPGPWIEELKALARSGGRKDLLVQGSPQPFDRLQGLLVHKKGRRIAYLTDFIFEEGTLDTILPLARGVDRLYCESNYAEADEELARKNYHLTTKQAAQIARACEARELVLFHFSVRYPDWEPLFQEARAYFENVR